MRSDILESIKILLIIGIKHKKILEIFLEDKTGLQSAKKMKGKQTKKPYRGANEDKRQELL